MIINLDSSSKALQLLNTQSRRADLSPVQLAEVHRALGRVLSYEYVNGMELETIQIAHVQGVKDGIGLGNGSFTVVIALMRSGLYVAEGFREILDGQSRLEFINGATDLPAVLNGYNLQETHVVLADSVINSGKSVEDILAVMPSCKSVTVVCQVMQEGFALSPLTNDDTVTFITCRISSNYYVGSGKTDTGDRLFGHIPETALLPGTKG
jgi:uracil phosphoribosyltransferase